MINVTTFC